MEYWTVEYRPKVKKCLGGRPCGTGLRPHGTPFLHLASALLCTGIDVPWCLLVKPIKR